MKKFSRFVCAALVAVSTLFAIGCGKSGDDSSESTPPSIDYNAETLVIDGVDSFAPCFVRDFLFGNEHSSEYFQKLNNSVYDLSKLLTISMNGEVWTDVDFLHDVLPLGEYELNVKTSGELFIPTLNEDDVIVNAPYNRDFTITINVSVDAPVKY